MKKLIFKLKKCPLCEKTLARIYKESYKDRKVLKCNKCYFLFSEKFDSIKYGNFSENDDDDEIWFTIEDSRKIKYTSAIITYGNYIYSYFSINNINMYDIYDFRYSSLKNYEVLALEKNIDNYIKSCNYVCKMLNNIIFV